MSAEVAEGILAVRTEIPVDLKINGAFKLRLDPDGPYGEFKLFPGTHTVEALVGSRVVMRRDVLIKDGLQELISVWEGVIDGRTEAISFGDTVWKASDYRNDTIGHRAPPAGYGRDYHLFYGLHANQPPTGWRLPSVADWDQLLSLFKYPFSRLHLGGGSGFDMKFNGYYVGRGDGGDRDRTLASYYWTSTPGSQGAQRILRFDKAGRTEIQMQPMDAEHFYSVRWVRDK